MSLPLQVEEMEEEVCVTVRQDITFLLMFDRMRMNCLKDRYFCSSQCSTLLEINLNLNLKKKEEVRLESIISNVVIYVFISYRQCEEHILHWPGFYLHIVRG